MRLVASLLLTAVLVGCTGEPDPPPSPSPAATDAALPTTDPDVEAMTSIVGELEETVALLRDELEAAAGGDADALMAAAELLVADADAITVSPSDGDDGAVDDTDDAPTDGTTDRAGPAPVLPGPRVSREESIQYGDLLTRTLAAARGAGGDGEPVLRFLADPLAGDLGAWQRAPRDQLAAITRAGQQPDLASTEEAVLELAGEAPRALAWVVHGLDSPADASDAAGRALAHLAIIELSLDQLG